VQRRSLSPGLRGARAAAILLATPHPPPPRGATGASPRPSRVGLGGPAAGRVQAPRGRRRHQVIAVGRRGSSMLPSWARTLGSHSEGSGVSRAEAAASPRDPQFTLRLRPGGSAEGPGGAGRAPHLTALSVGTQQYCFHDPLTSPLFRMCVYIDFWRGAG
jgi:hypothetical protein